MISDIIFVVGFISICAFLIHEIWNSIKEPIKGFLIRIAF